MEKWVTGVPKHANVKPDGSAVSADEVLSPMVAASGVAPVMSSQAVGMIVERVYRKYGVPERSNIPLVVPAAEPTAMMNVWLVRHHRGRCALRRPAFRR